MVLWDLEGGYCWVGRVVTMGKKGYIVGEK